MRVSLVVSVFGPVTSLVFSVVLKGTANLVKEITLFLEDDIGVIYISIYINLYNVYQSAGTHDRWLYTPLLLFYFTFSFRLISTRSRPGGWALVRKINVYAEILSVNRYKFLILLNVLTIKYFYVVSLIYFTNQICWPLGSCNIASIGVTVHCINISYLW